MRQALFNFLALTAFYILINIIFRVSHGHLSFSNLELSNAVVGPMKSRLKFYGQELGFEGLNEVVFRRQWMEAQFITDSSRLLRSCNILSAPTPAG